LSISRHAGYNLIGSVIPIVLSLATVPIYLRLVGPDRYGVLAIAWLLLGYFGLFDLGLGRATSFRIAALRDAAPRARADTFWAALAVNLGMGLVGGAVLWAAAGYFFGHVFKVDEQLRPEILAGVPLLAASVPIATLTGVLTGAMQGREKFLETNTVSVISTTLFQLLPLAIAWKVGPNLVVLLCAALAARALAVAVLAYRCHMELTRGHPPTLLRNEIAVLMKYGGWVTVTSIFGPMLVIVDRFAIGAILGAVAVTLYTVPFQLAQRIAILPSAITNALFPKMSAASPAERETMGDQASLALVCLMSLPVLGAIFLLAPFLDLWVGHAVGAKAAPVGRILLIGFWANAFALIPYTRLQASGRPDLVTKVLLLQIPPYILALYLGMKYLGLPGSALAFSARCIVDYALLTWAAGRRFTGLRVLGFNFALLVLGAWLSGLYPLTSWTGWAGACPSTRSARAAMATSRCWSSAKARP
jgi:O-antigen/teichoic acid export membrane protein